jgi:hypothetical protein
MSRLAHDIRVAARTLLRTRFISGLAIVAFALGIGVTTAVFSIFSAVLLAPLPFPHPEQLVAVYDTQPACATCPVSFPKYHDWVERNQVFSAMGGSTGASFVLTGRGEPTRERGTATTASLADVFGVRPQIGRWYTAKDDQPGGPKVSSCRTTSGPGDSAEAPRFSGRQSSSTACRTKSSACCLRPSRIGAPICSCRSSGSWIPPRAAIISW